jgi:ABC-type Zn uptake system ZnuABC Zn-binding protein ZnuA
MRGAAAVLAAGALALGVAACGGSDDGSAAGTGSAAAERLVVATTVAPLASIAENVIGDRHEVVQLVPDGTNSHTYEPTPSNAKDLERADVVFVNGLNLEKPTLTLAEANTSDGAEIVLLGERTVTPDEYVFDSSYPRDRGDPNPHLWVSPAFALRYGEIVTETMSKRDPENASYYATNLEALRGRIDALDAAITRTTASIPARNRKLVTYHDSYAYFAPVYGFRVIGAVQPSDFSEPSPKDVQDIITQVRESAVPAVFGSEVFPSDILTQISRESGARFVDRLSDDALPGQPGDPDHTYVGMMARNMRIIAENLGGDPSLMDGVNVTDVTS